MHISFQRWFSFSLSLYFVITLQFVMTSGYVLVDDDYANFTTAIQRCRDMHRELVSIHNETAADNVAALCADHFCWIGLRRDANETDFEWIDGSNSTDYHFPWYNITSHRNPNVPSEEAACVGLVDGAWFDVECDTDTELPFICGPQSYPFILIEEEATFFEAVEVCQDKGRELVSIHNETEADDVADLCAEHYSLCWIGLFRDVNEANFEWVDGSNSTDFDFPWYDSKANSNPNVPSDEAACVLLVGEDWFDVECDKDAEFPFICGR